MIREAIQKAVEGQHLTEAEARAAMGAIMDGEATPAQVAALLTALRMKGETVDEITGFARAMRERAEAIHPRVDGTLVDTCGTGGDGSQTFNVSTAAAFVVAACHVPVAKHGNRSASSRCGSADVLEALGVRVDLTPTQVQACIEETGIGFLFAPVFHKAMKHAIGPRREIGVRTVFNVLGPLTNPANARAQVVGVYDAALTSTLATVLGRLGVEKAFVVHGLDRLDEVSISERTQVSYLKDGQVQTFTIAPEEIGLPRASRDAVRGGDPQENAAHVLAVLQGEPGPRRDIVLLNAAAALVVAGQAANLGEGVAMAAEAVDSGRAKAKLDALAAFSQACA